MGNRPYTAAQTAVRANATVSREALIRKIVGIALEARGAVVPLPHVNEAGARVTHGCNVDMDAIAETYLAAARPLWQTLSVDAQEAIAKELGLHSNCSFR